MTINESINKKYSNNTNCIECGDAVEVISHRVCFWHAICSKNNKGRAKYVPECKYALEHFSDPSKYMERVDDKKNQLFCNVFS